MSIGREKMSDDASQTSGAPPTSGSALPFRAMIVLFDVMCTYAAPGVSFSSCCRRNALEVAVSSVVAATLVAPTFFASFSAFFAQSPVTM